MTKNFARGLAALSLSLAPLLAPAPGHAQSTEVTTLADALHRLPVADERHEGYSRGHFKHWNAGLDKRDGCDTRAEVLIAEAEEAPTVGKGCTLSDGEWVSYYDNQEVDDPDKLAVAHLVPLAEAWSSGASGWSAERREDYANDQRAPASLVAVTERTNRSKAAQDPAGWMPPLPGAHCRYLSEWVSTKLRWDLAANPAELDAIAVFANGECKNTSVIYKAVP
ncbi:HNH endonuclease family protein [Streptomyces sp. NPDC050147]|uniref:HNH endonuclease family protein n=1 Tax=Streptomyces sp. NPDC050147 TaxID=3155513 RepID=UPI003415FF28